MSQKLSADIAVRRSTPADLDSARRCLDAVARERRWLAMVEAPPIEQMRYFLRTPGLIQFPAGPPWPASSPALQNDRYRNQGQGSCASYALGHLLLGRQLIFFSLIGMVALSGVVVNASLMLVHRVNHERAAGRPLAEAVLSAAQARFRPIMLTSMTTFAGLMPLMLERAVPLQMMVPMAISLAFGVLTSTLVTLVLVPCEYLLFEDLGLRLGRLRAGAARRRQGVRADVAR